jgi:glycosyltransferase involved in cell wall biosynthesis
MNDKRYFVSVIIPIYNGESYIMEALESVFRQDYLPQEIIIVDDGSTDKTAGILSDLPGRIRYISQKNQGPASARNRGILNAKEPILAFLDIDDLWVPNKLSTQINYIAQHPEIQYTIANFKYFLLKAAMSAGSWEHW